MNGELEVKPKVSLSRIYKIPVNDQAIADNSMLYSQVA
jgi:hypothetical protein